VQFRGACFDGLLADECDRHRVGVTGNVSSESIPTATMPQPITGAKPLTE